MSRDSGVFVTDTHPLAYYADRRFSKLGKHARGLFDSADQGAILICIPTIVLAEMTILLRLERLRISLPFDKWCRDLEAASGFSIEPLLWTDVTEMRQLPFKDPFDRMIVGTAKRLQLPLITKDAEIAESGLVETVW
jgi:PIN domain nuclease of toxin-antitoxin system